MRHWFPTLASLTLLLAATPALALSFERLSLVGAATVTQYSFTPASGARATSSGYMGFGGGLLAELDLSKGVIGVELGALYAQRKYGDTARTYTETRLETPALLRLWIGSLGIGAGLYAAYGLGSVQVDGGSSSYGALGLSTLDLGWLASGAFVMGFGQTATTGLRIDARVGQSLTNASTQGGAVGKYLEFQLLAGLQFTL
jgi:hypothetical protein